MGLCPEGMSDRAVGVSVGVSRALPLHTLITQEAEVAAWRTRRSGAPPPMANMVPLGSNASDVVPTEARWSNKNVR